MFWQAEQSREQGPGIGHVLTGRAELGAGSWDQPCSDGQSRVGSRLLGSAMFWQAEQSPATWPPLGSCNGTQQSPIDIAQDTVQYNGSLGSIIFTNYSNSNTLLTISNTGHTVEVAIGNGVSVSGGGLPSVYTAIAFHFHWGNISNGSEHRLSGKQYPMEMHIVHTKNGMTLTDAKKDRTGIAVLGFFIDIMESANTSQLSMISGVLNEVSIPGTTLPLNYTLSLDTLLGNVNRTMYYRYLGSLTTPTCDEAVIWTVFNNPILVPTQVIQSFSSALKSNASGMLETIMKNFRPPQSLNGRQVQSSFQRSQSVNSTTAPNTTSATAPNTTSGSYASLQNSATLFIVMMLLLLN
ncbi:carbonic anhydrase 4-like [Pseudophryne corroboree]|uniref:carbonic anhydrase 4-like n=1 Tax=Pseudophryne corroboree TaxID=495146 RepID=UPI00308193E6